MKAVIDTNCLVALISPRSRHYWLYEAFKKELFYLSVNADFLVTEDSDFNVLKSIEFPKAKVISLNEFKEVLFKI